LCPSKHGALAKTGERPAFCFLGDGKTMSKVWPIRVLTLTLLLACCPRPAPAPIHLFRSFDEIIEKSSSIIVAEYVYNERIESDFPWAWGSDIDVDFSIKKIIQNNSSYKENSISNISISDFFDPEPQSLYILCVEKREFSNAPHHNELTKEFKKYNLQFEAKFHCYEGSFWRLNRETDLSLGDGKTPREAIAALLKDSLRWNEKRIENAPVEGLAHLPTNPRFPKLSPENQKIYKNRAINRHIEYWRAKSREEWNSAVNLLGEEAFRDESGGFPPQAIEFVETRRRLMEEAKAAREKAAQSSDRPTSGDQKP
jgi:hypothetical protein